MKKQAVILALIISAFSGTGTAQETSDKYTVPLTDPARPVHLKVGLLGGSITVKAHAGKDVIVEAKVSSDRDDDRDARPRNGLRRIPNTSSGLRIEEEDNQVEVSTGLRGMESGSDLVILVPVNTSAELSTVNDGDILVEGISGELEVNNTNGNVTMKNISGSAVAHALNGDLTVTFTAVTPQKAMSFSSLNGTIDVTFPPSVKASLNLKSDQGEIYTDFDVVMDKSTPKVEREENSRRRRVVIEKSMKGTINGGGAEYLFKNFQGDIYIRKGK